MYDDDDVVTSSSSLSESLRTPKRSLAYVMRLRNANAAGGEKLVEAQLAPSLLEKAIPPNTRRAYKADKSAFDNFRDASNLTELMPTDPDLITQFIESRIQAGCSPGTVIRNLTGVIDRYDEAGVPFPMSFKAIRSCAYVAWQDHAALNGLPQPYVRQVKPIVNERLLELVAQCNLNTSPGVRNKALLTTGKFGMVRRGELSKMQITDVHTYENGTRIELRDTKTSGPDGSEWITLYHEEDKRLCPVCALKQHLELQGRETGPVFRAIDQHGNLRDLDATGQPVKRGISGTAIACMLKSLSRAAGRDATDVSGHGMRRGGITDARRRRVGIGEIMVGARIKRVATLDRYTDYAIMLGAESKPNFLAIYVADSMDALT